MKKADSMSIMSIRIWGFKLDLQNKQMHESAILKVAAALSFISRQHVHERMYVLAIMFN